MKNKKYSNHGAIAIMTSGGDAPGMNACLRGCVRSALAANFRVYAVCEGYQDSRIRIIDQAEFEAMLV